MPSCPQTEPQPGAPCSSSPIECEYGEECCCGRCSSSIVYQCYYGRWSAYHTGFCLNPSCQEGETTVWLKELYTVILSKSQLNPWKIVKKLSQQQFKGSGGVTKKQLQLDASVSKSWIVLGLLYWDYKVYVKRILLGQWSG